MNLIKIKNSKIILFIIFIISILSKPVFSADPIIVDDKFQNKGIGLNIDYMIDDTLQRKGHKIYLEDMADYIFKGKNILPYLEKIKDKYKIITIHDITNKSKNYIWEKSTEQKRGFGLTRHIYWIRFTIKNRSNKKIKLYLQQNYTLIHNIVFYTPGKNKKYSGKYSGLFFDFNKRLIKHRTFLFPFTINPKESNTYFISFSSIASVNNDLTLWTPQAFNKHLDIEMPIIWIYYGMLIIIFIYNLLIFFTIKDINYLYYILFIASFALHTMFFNGLIYQYILPVSGLLGTLCTPFTALLLFILLIQFIRYFVEVKKYSPAFDKILRLGMVLPLILFLLFLFSNEFRLGVISTTISNTVIQIFVILMLLYFVIKYKSRQARFILIAFAALYTGMIIFALNIYGLIPGNPITDNARYIGSIIQIILFSLGLADKISIMKNELHTANLKLEKKVEEKTNEFHETNELLNSAYLKIKDDLLKAKNIQDNILPQNINQIFGLKFYVKYLPLIEIGGDIYDIYKHHNGFIRIFLADATGHGIVASMVTMLIKNEYDILKITDKDPFQIFDALNKIFINNYKSLNMFFTGIIMDIHNDNKKIIYSSAGSPPQFLIRDNEIIELHRTGRAVGMFGAINCVNNELEYKNNDRFLLYTDGLFEEFNQEKEEYGEQRIIDIINSNFDKSLLDTVNIILEDINNFASGAELNDDITVIAIE